ncbi:MAG: glycosyltransferase family 4 protein [Mojavia pulchra JT2-VF2]|jgi:glycosyltransferase involved in cell wall biosynthesis|uniref:Glycosyltransferase family 4 protein n=1 Tax=Mojavia pulchra JT2-VF2 TaxID=287848 RepID=A0A951UFL9_9NOST|nr:glycosyltransferase family 4 protein [Mojavia pulchra JT2-VF2]
MKIVHITPTYFDESSIIGGGERYPTELAAWMANFVDTTLVSFSSARRNYHQDALKIETYPVQHLIHGNKINPLSFQYLSSIISADIVHIHHIHTLVSDLGCLLASLLGKRVFVTDYGGGGSLVLNQKLPVFRGYKNAIAYSRFGLDFIPVELQKKSILIKGGIDTDKFCPDAALKKEKNILYVGRILPHKGINYLIDAFRLLNRTDYKLKIVGRVYSEKFYQDLKQQADGLNVEFVHDADDQQLLHEYRTAMVTVLPSVHTSCYGDYTPVPELMGFTLLESQACGTPVICTDAGAMHEFVDNGKTGFVVKQNSGEAIATAIKTIIDMSPSEYTQYQLFCREWIKPLSWSTVVQRHLDIYKGAK